MKNKTKNQIKHFLATFDTNKILQALREICLIKNAHPQYINNELVFTDYEINWDNMARKIRLVVHRNIPTANIKKWLNTIDITTRLKEQIESDAYEAIMNELYSDYENKIYDIIDPD